MNIKKEDFDFLLEIARDGSDLECRDKVDSIEKKYKESSFEKIEVMEEIYRQFLKGTLTETKLAYRTARDHILHELKIKFDVFFSNLRKDEII